VEATTFTTVSRSSSLFIGARTYELLIKNRCDSEDLQYRFSILSGSIYVKIRTPSAPSREINGVPPATSMASATLCGC